MTNAYIDPKVTALLVIDMQKGYCHPESQMEKSGPGRTSRQRGIIPNIVQLVRLCRSHELPILWSKQIHYSDDVARGRRRIPSHMEKAKFHPCLRGTFEVDFMEDIGSAIEPADHVFEKHRASCFFETTLPAKLRMLGTEILIISGVNTEFCVETTIREAYFRDLDVVVIEDCVASGRPAFHDDTLAKVRAFFGDVVKCADLPSLFVVPPARAVR